MPRILILGGGFAGVYTAQHLESLLRADDDVEIVLVNQENYFVFQPLLAEVVSGNIGLLDMVNPIRRMLKRMRLYVREIESIDLASRTVTLVPGFRPRADVLHYDHLVLALGSVTDFRGVPGLHEHALPFKTLADAVHLRNHVLHALEEALQAGDYFGEQALLNNRTRAATIRCRSAMNLLALRKGDFRALTANLPELRESFERVMEQRMALHEPQSHNP